MPWRWRHYLDDHFDRLTRPGSNIFVLGGIHGREDGDIGRSDKDLVENDHGQIEWFKENRETEMVD